jgi:hypothetical protein
MRLETVRRWAYANLRIVVYVVGSLVVSAWTLLRFFTERSIFDLVSQQVIVQQWLHGAMSPAHMGQTAYVPKMLLLYIPLTALHGSPRLKLILITLVVNAVTFVLIALVLEKILRELGVPIRRTFYVALLWFSAIAGSVFWIEFVNSRNLEVVGGLFWLYLCLVVMHRQSLGLVTGMILFGCFLFFDDPLQFYMVAVPMLVYALVRAIAKRQEFHAAGKLSGVTVTAYLGAWLLSILAAHALQLTFKDTGGVIVPSLSPAWMLHSLTGFARATASLFAGGADASKLRELANIGVLALCLVGIAYTYVRRSASRELFALTGCIIAVDAVVFVVSGQAVQGAATSRYLILLAPLVVLAASGIVVPLRARLATSVSLSAILAINLISLGVMLGRGWDTSFSHDAHLESVYRYTIQHSHAHIFASADTSMPILYYHNLSAQRVTPLGCLDGRAVRTHFSMDSAFDAADPRAKRTAIILDGNTIANAPNLCTIDTLTQQLGTPSAIARTDDGSAVLLYEGSTHFAR